MRTVLGLLFGRGFSPSQVHLSSNADLRSSVLREVWEERENWGCGSTGVILALTRTRPWVWSPMPHDINCGTRSRKLRAGGLRGSTIWKDSKRVRSPGTQWQDRQIERMGNETGDLFCQPPTPQQLRPWAGQIRVEVGLSGRIIQH